MDDFLDCQELRYIENHDEPWVGKHIVNLAHLKRSGIPVDNGLVVLAPLSQIQKIFKQLNIKTQSDLETNSNKLRSQVLKIDLLEKLEKHSEIINLSKVWKELLLNWLDEAVLKFHLTSKLNNLSPQIISLRKKPESFGTAFLNPVSLEIEINVKDGKLSESERTELKNVIKNAHRKLAVAHEFDWAFDSKDFYLTGLSLYTPGDPKIESFVRPTEVSHQKTYSKKTSTKLFFDASNYLKLEPGFDGVVVNSNQFERVATTSEWIEQRVWKLSELALSIGDTPLIYKLNQQLLDSESEIVLFLRNKKQLFNLQIAISSHINLEDFKQTKIALASKGITRKGSLKLWLEFGNVENFINLKDYVEVGLDGIIINLDMLASSIYGEKYLVMESGVVEKVVIKFLEGYMKLLKQQSVPLIFTGELLTHDEVIRFLIDQKVFGVLISPAEQLGLADYIFEIENYYFNHRLAE